MCIPKSKGIFALSFIIIVLHLLSNTEGEERGVVPDRRGLLSRRQRWRKQG
jgi:hypothetical protein